MLVVWRLAMRLVRSNTYQNYPWVMVTMTTMIIWWFDTVWYGLIRFDALMLWWFGHGHGDHDQVDRVKDGEALDGCAERLGQLFFFREAASLSWPRVLYIYIHYIGIYWLCLFIRVVKMVKHIFFLYDGHLEGVPHWQSQMTNSLTMPLWKQRLSIYKPWKPWMMVNGSFPL